MGTKPKALALDVAAPPAGFLSRARLRTGRALHEDTGARYFVARVLDGVSVVEARASRAIGNAEAAAARRSASAPHDLPVRARTMGFPSESRADPCGPFANWRALRSEKGPKTKNAADTPATAAVSPVATRGSVDVNLNVRASDRCREGSWFCEGFGEILLIGSSPRVCFGCSMEWQE